MDFSNVMPPDTTFSECSYLKLHNEGNSMIFLQYAFESSTKTSVWGDKVKCLVFPFCFHWVLLFPGTLLSLLG